MFKQQDIKEAIIRKVPHIALIYYLLTLLIKHFIGISDKLGTFYVVLALHASSGCVKFQSCCCQ